MIKLDTDKMLARKDGAIGWVTFNNPERRNAMSLEMWSALSTILAHGTWRTVVVVIACTLAALIPLVLFFLPEQPSDLGQTPFGADADQLGHAYVYGKGQQQGEFGLVEATDAGCGQGLNLAGGTAGIQPHLSE